jgi:flagellar capping protein FliD
MPARKAKKRGTKKAGTKKATKTNLEAKITKLQAKLNALSAQAAKSAKARALPPNIHRRKLLQNKTKTGLSSS